MINLLDENAVASIAKKNKFQQQKVFNLTIEPVSSHLCKATVTVNPKMCQTLYEQTVKLFMPKGLYGVT